MVFGPSEEQLANEAAANTEHHPRIPDGLDLAQLRSMLLKEIQDNEVIRKQLHDVKAELAKVALRFEEEDERIAITFIKQFEEVKKHEEVALIRAEEETERVSNKLQRQLEDMRGLNEQCSRGFEAEQERILNRTQRLVAEAQLEAQKWKDLYHSTLVVKDT
jgi:hypothetical protein